MTSTKWCSAALATLAMMTLVLVHACTKEAESSVSAVPTTPSQAAQATPVAVEPPPPPGSGSATAAVEPQGQNDPVVSDQGQKDKSYAVKVDAPASVASGASGKASITVTPSKGWKMNKEFPTKLEVTAPDGVTLTNGKQAVKDAARFDDHGATFVVDFKADSAGQKTFNADFKFAVCTDATCDPKREKLAWVVDVK